MKKQFEMSEDQLKRLLKACEATPLIMLQCGHRSPQESANAAWATLGREIGFDPTTVRPVSGKGQRCFTAEPTN